MFKFFKDKLKGALESFSKKVEAKSVDVPETEEPLLKAADIEEDKIEEKTKEAKEEKKEEIKEEEIQEEKPIPEVKSDSAPLKAELEELKKTKEEVNEEQPEIKEEKAEFHPIESKKIPEPKLKAKKEEKPFKTEMPAKAEKPITQEEQFEEVLKKTQQQHGLEVFEEPKEAKKESGLFSKIKGLFGKKEDKKEEKKEAKQKEDIKKKTEEEKPKQEEKPKEEKKGLKEILTEKFTKRVISSKEFDEFFSELEIALLENNVAVEVMEKIKNDMKTALVDKPISRNKIKETIIITLKSSIEQLFEQEKEDILQKIRSKKPFIILFFGVNGSGKTTTIAKLAKLFQDENLKPVMAAADTFRAAAIQQLEEHAKKLNVPIIKKDYGADPAAVAFDAIKFAESNKMDVVLIDTAGRLQSNVNLMDEMRKMVRVSKPDMKIFIGESTTGNDCVEQAKRFNEVLGIDAIILSKADVDEKGGAAISVSYVTKKPIIYIGTGQNYADLEPFRPELIVESLGL